MNFYSGFCLKGEEAIFDGYHDSGDFCIAGFSLGAIDAFEYACESEKRIDKLQLFSPAFFEDKEVKFKRLQEMYFKKDKAAYIKNFLKNIAYPSHLDMQKFYHDSKDEDLHKLLYYRWSKEKLQALCDRGIMIEVHLGRQDKIIDTKATKAFFQAFATVIMIKDVGHILKEKNG